MQENDTHIQKTDLKEQTVLVTGGAGFIGSNVVGALLDAGYRTVCVDNFDDTYEPELKERNIAPFLAHERFVLHRTDICDAVLLGAVFAKEKPSYVVHLAAKADTRNAVDNPHVYMRVNIDGTLNVLEEVRKSGTVLNTVIASSSSVYGNNPEVPWQEEGNTDRPISPYGMTKKATELLAHAYHHNFGLNITCLRYFNAYGENNRPNMVPYIWTKALLEGGEIEIAGEGTRQRDYTYVGDTVRATLLAMQKPLGFEVLNIGNHHPVSLRELLLVLEKATGTVAHTRSREAHKASVEVTYADITKAKELLGWEPQVPIEEGAARLVAWFRRDRLK